MADIKTLLTSANLVPLGFGIAIGSGLLFSLIELWPAILLTGAGYCIYKGFSLSSRNAN